MKIFKYERGEYCMFLHGDSYRVNVNNQTLRRVVEKPEITLYIVHADGTEYLDVQDFLKDNPEWKLVGD